MHNHTTTSEVSTAKQLELVAWVEAFLLRLVFGALPIPAQSTYLSLLHLNNPGVVRGFHLGQPGGGDEGLRSSQRCLLIKALFTSYVQCCLQVMGIGTRFFELTPQVIDFFQQGDVLL